MKKPEYSDQLNPLIAQAEQSLEDLDTKLTFDVAKQEEEKRKADELAAALKQKAEDDAAELVRAQKAQVERVKELQQALNEAVGVGCIIHNPVRPSRPLFRCNRHQ
jgi:hypothetical protein